MKKILFSFLLILLIVHQYREAIAVQIQGKGFGSTIEEAKKYALADLSSAIQIEVKSNFKSISGQFMEDAYQHIEEVIQVKSELPLLGVDYTDFSRKNNIQVLAALESGKALPLYISKLSDIREDILTFTGTLKSNPPRDLEHQILLDLFSLIDRYHKYAIVARLLGEKNVPPPGITEAEVRMRLAGHNIKVPSIDLAAYAISKGITEKGIYIFPPTMSYSHEITQFASAVKDALSVYLESFQSPDKAEFFMIGQYRVLSNALELSYRLVNRNSEAVKSRVVVLLPEAYDGYGIYPVSINFDKLLYYGYVVSDDFRVDISTNLGRKDLLFKKGEGIKLFIKMNNPGYVYMIGHVLKGDKQYSYLAPIQNAEDGNRRFVYYLNADDVNKWINLGKFDVVRPFGVESLQLIASTGDLVDSLPSYTFDKENDLYMLSEDPHTTVKHVRALNKVKPTDTMTAETVLMFTTMEK